MQLTSYRYLQNPKALSLLYMVTNKPTHPVLFCINTAKKNTFCEIKKTYNSIKLKINFI